MHSAVLQSKAILKSCHQLQDAADVGLATQELAHTAFRLIKMSSSATGPTRHRLMKNEKFPYFCGKFITNLSKNSIYDPAKYL